MNAPLEVHELKAGYGKAMILKGVSLTVEPGEIVCIAGPNGAGKSTLLKAIAGLIPWTAGSVRIYGRSAPSGTSRDPARDDVGVVPQVSNVFPSLSVNENLQVACRKRWSTRKREERLAMAYESFPDLEPIKAQGGGTLSGGQRQALAFAMALIREPKLLLLDEPTAALAPNIVTRVFEHITQLRAAGIPMLLIEQNVRGAMDVSDRAYFLENGMNALEGTCADLKDDPKIREVYLGGHADVSPR